MSKTRAFMTIAAMIAMCVLSSARPSQAATITLAPSSTGTNTGDHLDVLFQFSGGPGEDLSSFDIDVWFDEAVLTFVSASFVDPASGTNQLDLAEPGAFPFIGDASLLSVGVLDVFAVSGNSEAVLASNQAGTFTFLVLSFLGVAPFDATSIGVDSADPFLMFLNGAGSPLNVGTIASVTPAATPIPEPATLLLVGTTLSILGAARRRGRTPRS